MHLYRLLVTLAILAGYTYAITAYDDSLIHAANNVHPMERIHGVRSFGINPITVTDCLDL